jgi:hypothetical protein
MISLFKSGVECGIQTENYNEYITNLFPYCVMLFFYLLKGPAADATDAPQP